MKNNFTYACNLLLIKTETASNKCMLIELMSMFDKLQTQKITLKMNYKYNQSIQNTKYKYNIYPKPNTCNREKTLSL